MCSVYLLYLCHELQLADFPVFYFIGKVNTWEGGPLSAFL